MTREWINTAIGYLVLLCLQIFVFNKIDISVYLNIQVYIIFILLLPLNFYPLSCLVLSAIMGLSVDIFSSGTLGPHMAASVAAAYLRSHILKNMLPSADIQLEIPMPGKSPFRRYISYTLILVFAHHSVLFTLEAFDISEIAYIFPKILISGIVSTAMISLLELVVLKSGR